MDIIDRAIMYAPEYKRTTLENGNTLIWTAGHPAVIEVSIEGTSVTVDLYSHGHIMGMREAAQYTMVFSLLRDIITPDPEDFEGLYSYCLLNSYDSSSFVRELAKAVTKYHETGEFESEGVQ